MRIDVSKFPFLQALAALNWARIALVILLLGLGALIFEFSTLTVIKASNPWIKALPALVPFIALIATVFLSSSKDAWVKDLATRAMRIIKKRPLVLYICALLSSVVSVWFGIYVWKLAHAKEGEFIVQIIQKDDVPDQRMAGLPVILDQKLRTEVLERSTDSGGKAAFAVDVSDVFAIRIRQSAHPQAPVFVLTSDGRVNDVTKKGFLLVRLAEVPTESWIPLSDFANPSGHHNHDFAQLPAAFFRLHSHADPHVINVDQPAPVFPFDLPRAETIIVRESFCVGFSPVLRLPRWVAYKIMPGPTIPRERDMFRADPELPPSYQVSTSDYRGSGFDRGTLVRRADMFGLGKEATLESFYSSVTVPQLAYVNRKTWLALEEYALNKARNGSDAYVIRGIIYAPEGDGTTVNVTLMGARCVPIPTHFFQILFTTDQKNDSVEGHIVPNTYVPFQGKDVGLFKASVRSIAGQTGLAFDPKLLRDD